MPKIYNPKEIKAELVRLRAQIEKIPTQATFYMLSKITSQMLEGAHIDQKGLENVKSLLNKSRKTRIVFMPVFKSYADPLLMFYLNYYTDLEMGFTFGNYEDSPKIGFVERLLRRTGCFLIKRQEDSNYSTSYVN
jgi:glycerol-3-phosphate O-acyltransferase